MNDEIEAKMRAQMRMLQTGGMAFDGSTPRRVNMAELVAQELVKMRAERVEVDLQAAENQGHEKAVLRAISKKGVAAKLANDPKQAAKADVKHCWETWQNNPDEYESKEEFAGYMKERFPILKSIRKITDWCRKWEREPTKS